jgi:hypothetical protein
MFTVPFLVLMKAEEKYKKTPNEVNKKMLGHIKKTCLQLLDSNDFRNDLIKKIVEFSYQNDKISTRSADLIKSIPVFIT